MVNTVELSAHCLALPVQVTPTPAPGDRIPMGSKDRRVQVWLLPLCALLLHQQNLLLQTQAFLPHARIFNTNPQTDATKILLWWSAIRPHIIKDTMNWGKEKKKTQHRLGATEASCDTKKEETVQVLCSVDRTSLCHLALCYLAVYSHSFRTCHVGVQAHSVCTELQTSM